MPKEAKTGMVLYEMPPSVNEFRRFLTIFLGRPVVIFGAIIIIALFVCAAVPHWIAPYDPVMQNLKGVLLHPSKDHLLGTDALGRDMLSRIVFGARTALLVAAGALGMAFFMGTILGLAAGYSGGLMYAIIMRCIDALMAFPGILLALSIAALLGGGVKMVIIALGIGMTPVYARVMCGQAMSIKENDYVLAARSLSASNLRIMFRHVLPNAFPPMIVMLTIAIGMTIMMEAMLSYLGIGIKEPTVAWGSMVNDGYKYLSIHPALCFAPGAAIMVVVYAFNMVGDGLRDALDPRLRGVLK
jgi:peptide/nickel transport system permease protein